MFIVSSLFAAIIPMLIYLYFIWKMDKYEPEPIKFVMLHFLWGAFGAVFLGASGSTILGIFSNLIFHFSPTLIETTSISSVLFAPISEEFAKGLFIIFSSRSKYFDNSTDGIVYGAAIGLGFGMTENFLYFTSYGDNFSSWIYLVIIRSFFSAVMHAISTGIFGSFMGIAKYLNSILRLPLISFAMIISISIHSLWNFSVSSSETYVFGFLSMIFLISIFIQTLKYSAKRDKKIIHVEIKEEIENNFIPFQVIDFVNNSIEADNKNPIRKKILSLIVHLAFSKMKYKKTKGKAKENYYDEILYYRNSINNLFETNLL